MKSVQSGLLFPRQTRLKASGRFKLSLTDVFVLGHSRISVKFKVQQFRQITRIQAKWAHSSIKRSLTPAPPNQRTLWGSHTQQPFSQRRSQYSPSTPQSRPTKSHFKKI